MHAKLIITADLTHVNKAVHSHLLASNESPLSLLEMLVPHSCRAGMIPCSSTCSNEREKLYNHWKEELRNGWMHELKRAMAEFETVRDEQRRIHADVDLNVLRSARLVGMTTAGVASKQELVAAMSPKVPCRVPVHTACPWNLPDLAGDSLQRSQILTAAACFPSHDGKSGISCLSKFGLQLANAITGVVMLLVCRGLRQLFNGLHCIQHTCMLIIGEVHLWQNF